ncbi:MAG TPA: hypothetical protein VGB26_08060 [Nitrospiria bacterium]|jgi:hypothetical protein
MYAESEVYVEVGGEDATTESFDSTFSFQVYTWGYIEKQFQNKKLKYLVAKSVKIVDRFNDAIIRAAIESVLDRIGEYGIEQG